MKVDISRKLINRIDNKIFLLIAERRKVVKKVIDYRKKNNIPVRQFDREKYIIGSKVELAKEFGLDWLLIKNIFKKIIECSRK